MKKICENCKYFKKLTEDEKKNLKIVVELLDICGFCEKQKDSFEYLRTKNETLQECNTLFEPKE